MSATMKNGTPRKQLSDQLDRLDGVIDTLDGGLKAVVAGAVREAVGEAVQAVVLELMTNPELRRMSQPPPAEPPKDERPPRGGGSLLSRAWSGVCQVARSCAGGVNTAVKAARLAWSVAGANVKAALLLGAAAAAGVAYAARARVASAASAAIGFVKGLVGDAARSLGRLAPALAR